MDALDRDCAICGRSRVELLYHAPTSPGPAVRYRRCGLVYVSSIQNSREVIRETPLVGKLPPGVLTSADMRDVAGCWELTRLPEMEAEWPALRLNAGHALDCLHQHIQPPGRLLDLGCGCGFFLGVAGERGWTTYGVEPLPGYAVYARARFGACVVTDILRDDSFPRDFFDATTAFQVFEHLADPAREAARLHRMLRPGGVILVEVPEFDTWYVRVMGPRHRHFAPKHITFSSAATLALLLEKRGFRALSIHHPSRSMTLRHLVTDWGGRCLPERLASAAGRPNRRLGLWNMVVTLNLGDIVTVMARKPVAPSRSVLPSVVPTATEICENGAQLRQ
jgi:SAM-dependent methyltransferase